MLKIIIFDCDGVIADTEPLHFAAFQAVLAGEGISLTREDYYRRYLALDDRGCYTRTFHDSGRKITEEKIRELISLKSAQMEPMMRDHLKVFAGVPEFIRECSTRLPLAVASGALRHEVELILRQAGVSDCFRALVCAEDVVRGKPHPEPFVKALGEVNKSTSDQLRPSEALVIEDSIHGIEAAHEAGMRCVAVTTSYPKEQLSAADLIVSSLAGLKLDELEKLFP